MNLLRNFFAISTCVLALGCHSNTISTQDVAAATEDVVSEGWMTLDDDKFGAVGPDPNATGIGYSVNNSTFKSLLASIAFGEDTNFTVSPASILERGARIKIQGQDIDELMANLASKLNLSIERIDASNWRIEEGVSAGGSEVRITPTTRETDW